MTIRAGISQGWRLRRLALVMYGVEFLMASFLALQVKHAVDLGMGDSMDLERILKGFDYTLFTDFMSHHGDVFDLIFYQLLLFIPAFFVVNIFTTGGLLNAGQEDSSDWLVFWTGGSRYFPRIAMNTLIYLLVFLLWSMVLLVPLGIVVPTFLESCACEKWLFRIIGFVLVIYLLGLMMMINSSSISKAIIVEKRLGSWRAFREGWQYSFRHLLQVVGAFSFFMLATLVLTLLYHGLCNLIGMHMALTIFIVGVVQQFMIFIRVLLRTMYLYSMQMMIKK